MVYDLGGGTLDCSLLYMSKKQVNVLGTSGDEHLGGGDFDYQLFNFIRDKCNILTSGTKTNDENEDNKLLLQ